MAVVRDANATAATTASAVNTASNSNLTIGGSPNTVLIATFTYQDITAAITAFNWDAGGTPQALTLIGVAANPDGLHGAAMWGLLNPTPGNKTLTVTWGGATQSIALNCTSYTNCDLSGGSVATTFINFASLNGTGTGAGLVVPGAAGQMVVDCCEATNTAFTVSGTQTLLASVNSAGAGQGDGEQLIIGASATSAWTFAGSRNWVNIGCAIKAFAATVPSINLMGAPKRRFVRR